MKTILSNVQKYTVPDEYRFLARYIPSIDMKVEGIIAGCEDYSEKVLSQMPRLRAISRVGVGTDNIDLDYCRDHNISIFTIVENRSAISTAVAEYVLEKMIHNARSRRPFPRQLNELCIGVIGRGHIGTMVLKLLQPYGVCTFVYDIADEGHVPSREKFNFIVEMSDILTIHVPKDKTTIDLISESVLKRMKPDACLINTSRGGIINEKALYDHLSNSSFQAYLDTMETEPYFGPLLKRENCFITPHIASFTQRAFIPSVREAYQNVLNFLLLKELGTESCNCRTTVVC